MANVINTPRGRSSPELDELAALVAPMAILEATIKLDDRHVYVLDLGCSHPVGSASNGLLTAYGTIAARVGDVIGNLMISNRWIIADDVETRVKFNMMLRAEVTMDGKIVRRPSFVVEGRMYVELIHVDPND